MGYETLLLLFAVLLALPVGAWIRRHPERFRDPKRAFMLAFVGILAFVLALSALDGWLYPYGWPGREIAGLRFSAEACGRRYASARTAADTAAIDTLFLAPSPDTVVFSCRTLRRERLPRCGAGSRCARVRSALRLPEAS